MSTETQPGDPDDYFVDPAAELAFLIDGARTLRLMNQETIAEFKQLVNQAQATRKRSAELRRAQTKTR